MKRFQPIPNPLRPFLIAMVACCLTAAAVQRAAAATVTELKPLHGYTATTPADINDSGQVVGTSHERAPTNWLQLQPQSRATLWAGGKTVYLSKAPGWDPSDGRPTEAICINKDGQVLCVAHESSGKKSYYLWENETKPAIDLGAAIIDLKSAIDLNDKGQLLVMLTTGTARVYDIHDVQKFGASKKTLPGFPGVSDVNGSALQPELIGIDNEGRVVALWSPKQAGAPFWVSPDEPSTWSAVGYWKPSNPLIWSFLYPYGSDLYKFMPILRTPYLSKSGLVFVHKVSDWGTVHSFFFDLNLGNNPPLFTTSSLPGSNPVAAIYPDANSEGLMPGCETSNWSDWTMTLVDRNKLQINAKSLAMHFDPSWSPWYPVAIADKRIVGLGSKSGKTRAWLLDLGAPLVLGPGAIDFIDWTTSDSESTDFSGLDLLTPPPEELLRQFFHAMSPEERKLALERARAVIASAKAVEKVLLEEPLAQAQ